MPRLTLRRNPPAERRTACRRVARPRRSSGFTLLEVILALAIGTALMATVYVAASIHLQMADKGPAETAFTQRVTAVLELFEDDLHHVIAPPPGLEDAVAEAATGGGNDLALGMSGNEEATEDQTPSVVGLPFGLWGSADALVLYRTMLPTDFDLAEMLLAQGPAVPRPAVYRVMYLAQSVTYSDGTAGYAVYRSVVPAGFERAADELPLDPSAYPHYRLLLERVTFVQFAYFDGYDWVSEWGGATDPGPPPVAVELVLGVQPPPELGRMAQRNSAALAALYGIPAGSDIHRRVVAVPTVDEELVEAVSTASAGF